MELPHLDVIYEDESYDVDVVVLDYDSRRKENYLSQARSSVTSFLITQSVCGEQTEVLHLHDFTPRLPDLGAECGVVTLGVAGEQSVGDNSQQGMELL